MLCLCMCYLYWNYFSGMNDQQIIEFIKSDMIQSKLTQFSDYEILWNNALKR